MGQNSVYNRFSSNPLRAAVHSAWALQNVFPVNLAPNVSAAKGSLLVPGAANTNDVQTITAPGSGSYTLSGTNPLTGDAFATAAIPFNANDAAVQAALVAVLGAGNVAVASLAATFTGQMARMPVLLMTASAGSVAHTTTGASLGTYTVYAGSGTPTCWLEYDCSTDAAGLATFGLNGGIGDQQGGRRNDVPAYFAGEFYAAELPNLDSAAVTAMKARFITGSLGVAGAIISIK